MEMGICLNWGVGTQERVWAWQPGFCGEIVGLEGNQGDLKNHDKTLECRNQGVIAGLG